LNFSWYTDCKFTTGKTIHQCDMKTKIFLCGDVMTGRGIDQILPEPSLPRIYEPYIKDASDYVRLAEEKNGQISSPVDYRYIWGDALEKIRDPDIDFRLINLETSITHSNNFWRGKGINYRMNPENIHCITAAGINCCSLANNHVIDWGYEGLKETLFTLEKAQILHTGAGDNIYEAQKPARFSSPGKRRILIFGIGSSSSGIPYEWAAEDRKAGVNTIFNLSAETANQTADLINAEKDQNDIVIISIHWGENWGYNIPLVQKAFAHTLIDLTGASIIHGHSSHHVKGLEVYNGALILYGCGDFINDYEGILGYEEFRAELTFLYLVVLNGSGKFESCKMVPMHQMNFRLQQPSKDDISWLIRLYRTKNSIEGAQLVLCETGCLEII